MRTREMDEIVFKKATEEDIEQLMQVRLEMLAIVNDLPKGYEYREEFVNEIRRYFLEREHTTILALYEGEVVGCASMAYIKVMPTFSHPTGKRGHLMNVYTKEAYRRRGISSNMVSRLIEEAKIMGVTEISLDATDMGKPLYESLGFAENSAGMIIEL